MTVLMINGSPRGRGSNSLKLAEAFAAGMGDVALQTLHLAGMAVGPCRGCFACWRATPGRCVIHDDMEAALDSVVAADVVIWAFPLYYYSVPGILKNFIDRQLPLSLPFMRDNKGGGSGGHPPRRKREGQRHVIVSTCGFYSAQGNYDAVLAMFNHMCGKGRYEAILCGQGELFSIPEVRARTGEYLGWVRQAGTEYAADGICGQTRAQLSQLLLPKAVFEAGADASWGLEADGVTKTHESLAFTRQMAAMYRPEAYDGRDRVVELHYTDVDRTYQMAMGKEKCTVLMEDFLPYTTRVETPYAVWRGIARGEISGGEALAQGQIRVLGDTDAMMRWGTFFTGGGAASS